jgi:protoheme IX farnesyltransferase
VFKFSLLYLFLHFVALLVEAVLHAQGIGGW